MLRSLPFLLLALTVSISTLHAQAPSPSPSPALTPEYQKAFGAAVVAYEKQDFAAALSSLDAAEKAMPDYPETYNLRGGIYTQQRDYPKARENFAKALTLNAKSYPVRFNLAEVDFLEKKYVEARTKFEMIRQEIRVDKEAAKKNLASLSSLVSYKIYLTYVCEDRMADAKKELETFSFTDDTPAYYFANAVMDFKSNREGPARGWLASADQIYTPQINRVYADSLFELGWLKKAPVAPSPAPSTTPVPAATAAPKPAASPAAKPAATATPKAGASATPKPR